MVAHHLRPTLGLPPLLAFVLLLLTQVVARSAQLPSPADRDALTLPPAHLGYGINLRDPNHIEDLFAPLGFQWVKLYERYDAMPSTRLPYQVLFRIDLHERISSAGDFLDLDQWRQEVGKIAGEGRGRVEAYEIGNEPNMAWQWGNRPPDPAEFVQALCAAYEAIKAVDPGAIVVSGGLGPVGRIEGTYVGYGGNVYTGHNGQAMDEREYARWLFQLGAGDCFDAFGYHPFGFAYPPETAPDQLPPDDQGNGFTFRGVEAIRAIMEAYGLEEKPIWATEFGWARDPRSESIFWCEGTPDYDAFGWMLVSPEEQADYLVRAFQWADAHWPWMGVLFVWNLDWHDQGHSSCDSIRWFSLLRQDGSPSPAYGALAQMEKRPGPFGPRLAVRPSRLVLLVGLDRPQRFTRTLEVWNPGYRTFTWTATVSPFVAGGTLAPPGIAPTLWVTRGRPGDRITLTVDSSAITQAGLYTSVIQLSAWPTDTLSTPQPVTLTLQAVPRLYPVHLPLVLKGP